MGDTALNSVTKMDVSDALSLSRLPYMVDLKDWHRIPQHWRDEILRCYAGQSHLAVIGIIDVLKHSNH